MSSLVLVPPLPTQNMPFVQICMAKRLFLSLFWPLFGPRRAKFRTFWVSQMAHNGLSGCLHRCSNLFPSLPTQNNPSKLICIAKRLFLAYFCPFLAPLGPHLGHSGFGTYSKLVNLNVFIGIPTLFHPFQTKVGPQCRFVWPTGYSKHILAHFWFQ